MQSDEALRANRLVFYKETIDQIEGLIREFLKFSKAKCVYFIDRDGHLVTQVGDAGKANADALSALVAGSFAATRELARLLGESEFSTMSHKGKKDSISILLVGGRAMLAILYDDKTTAGMVNLYCKELSERVEKMLDIAERQEALKKSKEKLHEDFSASIQDKLDEIFED